MTQEKPKLPRIPKFSKRAMKKIIADLPAHMERIEKDQEDARCLRGRYAPEPGRCRVCPGRVIANIAFPYTGVIGGPPTQGHIEGWHCQDCGVVYAFCPPPRDP